LALSVLTALIGLVALPVLGAFNISRAQAQSDDTAAPIIVDGRRLDRAETSRHADEFVRRVGVMPQFGQYARWRAPICVSVAGIDPYYANIVAAEVDRVVDSFKLRRGPAGCRPNVRIVFAPDAVRLSRDIVQATPGITKDTRAADKEEFLKGEMPVRWIYTLATFDGSGAAVGPNLSSGPASGPPPPNSDAFFTSRYSSSLIDSNLIVALDLALIIVDLKRAEGIPLKSVAAYAARVALAQTSLPPPRIEAPTILGLFVPGSAGAPASQLTIWDEAYLRALYQIALNREGWTQRNRLSGTMVEYLLNGVESGSPAAR